MNGEAQYIALLKKVMDEGEDRMDRTGVGTRALFGQQMRFNMADGFPALTTKKLGFRAVKSELLWFFPSAPRPNEERKPRQSLHQLSCH